MNLQHKPLSYRVIALGFRNRKRLNVKQPSEAERLIVGYSTSQHLILDLDKSHSIFATERLVSLIQKNNPHFGDCLISESSWDGFHCIFDNRVSWTRILHVCSTLQGLNVVNRDFYKVRKFREDLTLRVSSIDRGEEKSEAPRPVMLIFAKEARSFPIINKNDEDDVTLFALYSEQADVSFSGVLLYLNVLSAFREVEELAIHPSESSWLL